MMPDFAGFGANPDYQDYFDAQARRNKIARLKQIYDLQDQYPGRMPGGTGLTGLTANDAAGWSNVLNEQSEAANLENELQGKGPLTIKVLPTAPLAGVKNLADDPQWWLQGAGAREPYDASGQVDVMRARRNAEMLPASLRALYAASLKPRTEKK